MPSVKQTKNPESVRFTMSGVVEKYPAMYGTAGVYMSSDSGVMKRRRRQKRHEPGRAQALLGNDEPFPHVRQLHAGLSPPETQPGAG